MRNHPRSALTRAIANLFLVGTLLALLVSSAGLLGMGCSTLTSSDPAMSSDAPTEEHLEDLAQDLLISTSTPTPVVTGSFHACAILEGGAVKCWGRNTWGQLGLGDTVSRGDDPSEMGAALSTVGLGTGRTAKALAAGALHTCALLDNDQVKCWGNDATGQLGLSGAAQSASGGAGGNPGPMGGSPPGGSAGTGFNSANRGDQPREMMDNLPAVQLGTGRTAKAIAAGGQHTCALLDNNQVKCWGSNQFGQLGTGDTQPRGQSQDDMGDYLPVINLGTGRTAKAVTAGDAHTCALLDNDRVKCWGRNASGQLGLGNVADRGDAPNELGDNLPAIDLGTGVTVKAVAAGPAHTCALLNNNQVKCWGQNTSGQLGLGDTNHRGDQAGEMGASLPTLNLGTSRTAKALAINGTSHSTCALLDNDRVKCWGDNAMGQLGLEDNAARGDAAGEMGDALPMLDLGTEVTVRAIAGGWSPCAVLTTARIKCWGFNADGQLGLGDNTARGGGGSEMGDELPPVSLGRRSARGVAAGAFSACAVSADGSIQCWGRNDQGQLGVGDTLNRGDEPNEPGYHPVPIGGGWSQKLAAGGIHSCALNNGGYVVCWGGNAYGQLGLGDTTHRGDDPTDLFLVVNLGNGRTAKSVSAGTYSTCALLDNNLIKCWGRNSGGALGLGDTSSRGDSAGEMESLPTVDLGTGRTAKALAAGGLHACAILDNNQLKCWGLNTNGQLGLGDTNSRGDAAGEMGDNLPAVDLGPGRTAKSVALGVNHTCAILDNNQLKCWGSNSSGKLGLESTTARGDGAGEMGANLPEVRLGQGRSAKAVSLGDSHTCALLDTNQVKCWGSNADGQLGLGDTRTRGNAAGQMDDFLPVVPLGVDRTVAVVTTGNAFTCVRLNTNEIKCWGRNNVGNLGVGDTSSRGDAPGEMGAALPAVDLGL